MKLLKLFSLSLICLSGCDPGRVYENYKEIPDGIWRVRHRVVFEADMRDTLSRHHAYVLVRHTDDYPFSNLCMLVHTAFPDGRTATDSVEGILADNRGRWLGSGIGDLWNDRILFKKDLLFPLKGKYVFTFEQAQRYGEEPFLENLPFIIDLGLRIEKQHP